MASNERVKWETIGCWLGWIITLYSVLFLFQYLESNDLAAGGTVVIGFINITIISAIGFNCLDDYLTKVIEKRIALKEYKARQARIAEQERVRQEQLAQGGQTVRNVVHPTQQHTMEQRRGHAPGRMPTAELLTPKEILFAKYEELLKTLLSIENVKISSYGEEVNVMGDNNLITTFRIKQLPGCCGVGVSTGVEVRPNFQGKGVSTLMNKFRQECAKQMSYGVLLCTDVESNIAQQKVLEKNKWIKLHSFRNPKTNNQVAIHCIDLN